MTAEMAMTADACETAAARSADLIYLSAAAGGACWARNHHGHRRELPMTRWMGGPETTPQDRLADEHVLGQCSSRPTLDVGCGPGRFTASLQGRGLPALGVDSSAAAVEMTRRRGGAAIRSDLFAPLPAEGSWEQILLTDGNIGIGGNPVRTLRRAADLVANGGIVIVEIDSPATVLCYEMLRWETDATPGALVSVVARGGRRARRHRTLCRVPGDSRRRLSRPRDCGAEGCGSSASSHRAHHLDDLDEPVHRSRPASLKTDNATGRSTGFRHRYGARWSATARPGWACCSGGEARCAGPG